MMLMTPLLVVLQTPLLLRARMMRFGFRWHYCAVGCTVVLNAVGCLSTASRLCQDRHVAVMAAPGSVPPTNRLLLLSEAAALLPFTLLLLLHHLAAAAAAAIVAFAALQPQPVAIVVLKEVYQALGQGAAVLRARGRVDDEAEVRLHVRGVDGAAALGGWAGG
jgi:hypothetical protein